MTEHEIKEWAKNPVSISKDGFFGRKIADELHANGWKTAMGLDYCSKANYEVNLEKNGKTINIVQASFLGSFTQVQVRNSVR
jgi:hypothetical protein